MPHRGSGTAPPELPVLWEMPRAAQPSSSPLFCLAEGGSEQPAHGTAGCLAALSSLRQALVLVFSTATNPPRYLLDPTQVGHHLAEMQPPTCFPNQAKELGREPCPARCCPSKDWLRSPSRGDDETRNKLYFLP